MRRSRGAAAWANEQMTLLPYSLKVFKARMRLVLLLLILATCFAAKVPPFPPSTCSPGTKGCVPPSPPGPSCDCSIDVIPPLYIEESVTRDILNKSAKGIVTTTIGVLPSGVAPGTYERVAVDEFGIVTAASNPENVTFNVRRSLSLSWH